jgi:hypothetical protein
MVAVSERAKELLLERKRAANIAAREGGLRVEEKGGEWVLVADRARSDDQVVEHEGVPVLLVGREVQAVLAGTRVDCVEARDGSLQLTLTRLRTQEGEMP